MRNRSIRATVSMAVIAAASIGVAPQAFAKAVHVRPPAESGPVAWTMAAGSGEGQCPNLAPGEALTGSGVHVVQSVVTQKNGVTTIKFVDHAEGVATDQDGNVYSWTYDNTSVQTNTVDQPDIYTGTMRDRFRLDGSGPIHLVNGFVGDIVDNRVAGTFDIVVTAGYGDALGHCDPL